jgi:hypothetical protein
VHEFSGFTVFGIRKALTTLKLDDVLLALSPATREALEQARLFKFHPGNTVDEMIQTVGRLHGVETAAAVMEEATRSSIEGIVAPLARMVLTLNHDDPAVLFARFNDLTRSTTRGITSTWTSTGPTGGRLSLTYEVAVDPVVGHGWRGALRYVLKFCRREGKVELEPISADPRTVALVISWVKAP